MKYLSRVVSVLVLTAAVLALGVSTLLAETDYLALEQIELIKKGKVSLEDPKLDTISEATIGAGVTLDGVTLKDGVVSSSAGVGTVVAALATVVEEGDGVVHKSTITIAAAANPTELADGADGEGIKIYDFPIGVIKIHSVVVSGLVCTNEGNFNASDNDHYYYALGTTEAGTGDDDLTALEANLIAKVDMDTAAGATVLHTNDGFLATTVIVDGSSTACDIWLNNSVEASDNSAACQTGFTAGTVIVMWSLAGAY